jgi:hypothetical protein
MYSHRCADQIFPGKLFAASSKGRSPVGGGDIRETRTSEPAKIVYQGMQLAAHMHQEAFPAPVTISAYSSR